MNEINVKIRKLQADAVIPAYATDGASGFDLVACEDIIIAPGGTAKVPLGLAFQIPEGYEMQIRPRSGVTLKTKLRVQLGTVDADYRGEVGVVVDNTMPSAEYYGDFFTIDNLPQHVGIYKEGTYIIRKGDRIAQGIIQTVPSAKFTIVDKLSDTGRGEGGFGSTGVKNAEVGE